MAARAAARRVGPGQIRVAILGLVMVVLLGGLGFRLFQVQVVQAAEFAEKGLDQRLVKSDIPPRRGTIFDRNGEPLAMTVDGMTIYAVPRQVENPGWVAQNVAALAGQDASALTLRILEAQEKGGDFVYLARQLETPVGEQIMAMAMTGVYSMSEPMRMYPSGSIAAQVVGLSTIDGEGLEGLEAVYDDVLRGTPGATEFERAAGGRAAIPQRPSQLTPAVPGDDITSTIDLPLQYSTLNACTAALERTGARSCWALALDPETGEVLSMVGAPEFDPLLRSSSDGEKFHNSIVRDQFEPGSIQKLVTVAAAIDTGVVRPDTYIGNVADQLETTDGACRSKNDDLFGCFHDSEKHDTRDMSVLDIFTISSNVGTIKIGSMIPDGALRTYLAKFGLGAKSGVDFNGESPGQTDIASGCSSCLASQFIGYSIAATPLQMAAAYAAIANDGEWVQPHLVRSESTPEGDEVPFVPERRRAVSEDTAWAMRQMLRMVVEDGTGTGAQVDGYQVGGKTGTASKLLPEGGYAEEDNVASFVGMAPIDDPKVVVAVVLDSPAFEFRFGGLAAAPVFAAVTEAALQRLGVAPDVQLG